MSSVTSAAQSPPVNLLANPSFEQAQDETDELAAGWGGYQCGYARTRERSYAPDISGPWSCRITAAGGAEEQGLGGTNSRVVDGLPEHGTFAATNSIYVDTHKQGNIYGAYVTAVYTDGTQQTFSFVLSAAQIKANLGRWRTYRFTFATDPDKKLGSMVYWCLVWSKGEQKFIGTVHFDEVELRHVETAGQTEVALPFALASHTSTPPAIDGVIDDECWRHSIQLSPFLLNHGSGVAVEQTLARLAWDEDNIYISLECYESVLDPVLQQQAAFKATEKAHDGNIWSDDTIELFLQPPQQRDVYYHLAINALGTVYDAECSEAEGADKSWESNAEVGANIGGKSWTLEMAIPRAAFADGSFATDDCWRMNICRSEKPSLENSCFSPTGAGFHTPERFALLTFGPPALGGGAVDLGGLRKGSNRMTLSVDNSAPQPQPLTVIASVADALGAAEVGKTSTRVTPRECETLEVEYTAPPDEGALRYEVYHGGRLVLISPAYPLKSSPFTAWLYVKGKPQTRVIKSFSIAQGELVTLPLLLKAGIDEEQFREAEVILDVPQYLHLITPVSAARRCPTPLAIEEQKTARDGRPYRRIVLRFGAENMTFPQALQERMLVVNPLIFRAEFVGTRVPEAADPQVIAYDVRVNGHSRTDGTVELNLLPPLSRKSPQDVVVCNWPCCSTYLNSYLGRLSPEEQMATGESWLRSGFNILTHNTPLMELFHERGCKTAHGLPGTLDGICGRIAEVKAYLRENPKYRDAAMDGTPLPNSVSPAHLLQPDCPVRQMIRDFVGKSALLYEVLSWDYEVPVALEKSIGFGAHNLAAFREFADIPDGVELTAEVAARDYRPQWIDFRCRQNAEVVKLLREGVKAANPDCMFFVYSGYHGEYTRETYGINWEYLAPHIDQAWCGYGRPVQLIKDTLEAIDGKPLVGGEASDGKPLVGGELVWLGYGTPYDLDTTETKLMRRLTDCAGGFMVYYDWFVDGRFYAAISRTAAVATDFEAFFRDGRRDDTLATVQAGDAPNVAVYSLNSEKLVVLFGSADSKREFKLQLDDIPAGAVGLDYWEKKEIAVSPMLTATVPAHGVKVILVRPDAGETTPSAPRLTGPKDGTISDRRPLLIWQHDAEATCRYAVEVSADPDFPSATTFGVTDLAANTYVITEPLDENGTYHWRVRAVDALIGKQGPWSDVGRFTLGVLGFSVQPLIFSPNGDDRHETVAVHAELRSEAPWMVTIADAAGQVLRSFSETGEKPSAAWDGRDADGNLVPEGSYEVGLAARGKQIAAKQIELNQRYGVPNPDLTRWCFWRAQALEGGSAELDYHTQADGKSYSLMLTGADPEARAYWTNYRSGTEIPITAGKTYTYTGLVKCDLADGAEATISLHFFTEHDHWAAIPGLEAEWEGITAACTGKQDWTQLTVSCEAPENAAKAVLFFTLKGQGTAWLSVVDFGEEK
jgi:hypothetical protein